MYEVTITKIENGDRENAKLVSKMNLIYVGVFNSCNIYEVHMDGEIFNVVRYADDIWELVSDAITTNLSGGYDDEEGKDLPGGFSDDELEDKNEWWFR